MLNHFERWHVPGSQGAGTWMPGTLQVSAKLELYAGPYSGLCAGCVLCIHCPCSGDLSESPHGVHTVCDRSVLERALLLGLPLGLSFGLLASTKWPALRGTFRALKKIIFQWSMGFRL